MSKPYQNQNTSKRKRNKNKANVVMHQDSPSDSGTVDKGIKSPVDCNTVENSESVMNNNHDVLGKESKESIGRQDSDSTEVNDTGHNFSAHKVSSTLLKNILKEDQSYNSVLAQRIKCSNCKSPNILIMTDLNEISKYLKTVLEENKSLKSEKIKLSEEMASLVYKLEAYSQLPFPEQSINSTDTIYTRSTSSIDMETDGLTSAEANVSSELSEKFDAKLSKNEKAIERTNYRGTEDERCLVDADKSSMNVINETSAAQDMGENWNDLFEHEEEGAWSHPAHDQVSGTEVTPELKGNRRPQDGDDTERRNLQWNNRQGNHDDDFHQTGRNDHPRRWENPRNRDRCQDRRADQGWEKPHDRDGRQDRSADRGWEKHRNRGGRQDRSADRGWSQSNRGGKRGSARPERTYNVVDETFGDLFEAPKDHSLAHCVAEDMRMGSGIAVTFRQMFKDVDLLLDQRKRSGHVAVLEHEQRFIYYLVTKKVSNGKPTYEDLYSSLLEMKDHCIEFKVKKVAMPRIGCGLDRLEWTKVKDMLEDIFQNTDVQITVFNFQQDPNQPEPIVPRSKLYVCQKMMKLVSIEAETGLIFLGTEDSHEYEAIKSLDTKHRFIHDYRRLQKKVGEVIKIERDDYLYGLIVKKTANEPLSYVTLNNCLCKLRDMIGRDKYQYLGIEAFIENDDDLTMEKFITVLKLVFFNKKLEAWICWPPELQRFCRQDNPSAHLAAPIN